MENRDANLTSSEIGSLWTGYMNDSMSKCILSYMLNHVKDPDIYPTIEQALTVSTNNLTKLIEVFEQENYVIPDGFTENDVNINAPSLYTDTFCLTYINHMAKVGMLAYSGFVAMSVREDMINYFAEGLTKTSNLYHQTTKIALKKGVLVRAPYIPVPKKQDYVDDKSYLSGLNLFIKSRPINAIEISHLFMNIQTNLIGSKLCLSFAQTSPLKDVQQFMLKGNEIAQKHIKIFSSILLDDNIQSPISSDVCITDSTIAPFSDKLMMSHMALLGVAGTGNYASAAATSQRSDLILNYERFSVEIGQFAKSGADIMIKNKWLEQPPGTLDKDKLAQKKELH